MFIFQDEYVSHWKVAYLVKKGNPMSVKYAYNLFNGFTVALAHDIRGIHGTFLHHNILSISVDESVHVCECVLYVCGR